MAWIHSPFNNDKAGSNSMQICKTDALSLSLSHLKFSTWWNEECLCHAFNNIILLNLKYCNPLLQQQLKA